MVDKPPEAKFSGLTKIFGALMPPNHLICRAVLDSELSMVTNIEMKVRQNI